MPDMAEMMNNPAMMEMMQKMMSDPKAMKKMQVFFFEIDQNFKFMIFERKKLKIWPWRPDF